MSKKLRIGIAMVLGILIVGVLGRRLHYAVAKQQRLYGQPRREWKEIAIRNLAHQVADSRWLTNEIAALRTKAADTSAEGATSRGPGRRAWVSDSLLLLRNGEWIVYTNICNKEDARIHDLFLGRGSDGKWYYSTYHFCIRMVTLDVWRLHQPDSLQRFALTCFLREFDGRSDDCLKETWGPKEYRESRAKWGGVEPP